MQKIKIYPSPLTIAVADSSLAITETEMIAAILKGDTHLYGDLVRPYQQRVRAMALSYMKNEADADDVTQEALFKGFRNLSSFRHESHFSTWLISITLNEAKNRIRNHSYARSVSLDEYMDGVRPSPPSFLHDRRYMPSVVIDRNEVRSLLHQAIHKLPEIYRQVYLLRDVEDLNLKQTADALKISIASVKVRLHRARIMLQKWLEPQLRIRRVGSSPHLKES